MVTRVRARDTGAGPHAAAWRLLGQLRPAAGAALQSCRLLGFAKDNRLNISHLVPPSGLHDFAKGNRRYIPSLIQPWSLFGCAEGNRLTSSPRTLCRCFAKGKRLTSAAAAVPLAHAAVRARDGRAVRAGESSPTCPPHYLTPISGKLHPEPTCPPLSLTPITGKSP